MLKAPSEDGKVSLLAEALRRTGFSCSDKGASLQTKGVSGRIRKGQPGEI
jgi:hypothetical protein